ncbi:DUF3800 domain-containing protein [Enterococcus dispar]|uniref:DUF3800 domain-containing protein n=1 Tax=Enterococcus dispar ATCC 51266 TaxID=1139219 RepID=S1N712_9ENTE|nr:DUF3800 domain-containing protein [Enterococcus dispar]EOT42737.1 hypothetical protein OMK_01098 [Enterococcus dispar ATCC 51266]EOW84812.1 hypothetical protein I569_00101 [Enterococcus dispar ATCC 51266]OJG38443.1 hypothetical protein RV01_GL002498 [Enterococcus dispar]
MRIFADESGCITKSKSLGTRFFVIAFLETDEPYNVIRQFRKAKAKYIRNNNIDFDIKDEIKGSEMPYGMKKSIFESLAEKTDVKFHFKIIDNFNIIDNLRSNTALAFNYFTYLTLANIHRISTSSSKNILNVMLDDRNTSIESLNSLEDYLRIKFMIETSTVSELKTTYKDSKSKDLIQVVDLFANTVFRIARNHAQGSNTDVRNRRLLEICNIGCPHYFPRKYCNIDICK